MKVLIDSGVNTHEEGVHAIYLKLGRRATMRLVCLRRSRESNELVHCG